MKVQAFGKVTDGNLKIVNRKDFDKELKFFEGKEIILTVERKTRKRTLSQNDYLHLLLGILTRELNELGNEFTEAWVKDMIKMKFLTIDVYNADTGQIIGQRIKGTSELTTTELNELIENIIRYGAEMFGFNLPYPSEQMTLTI